MELLSRGFGDKQLKILKSYRENPNQTLKEISERLCISFGFVQSTIQKYQEYQKIDKKLYLVPSYKSPSVYFLFDDFSEREIIVDNGIVQNSDDFTEYELYWIESQKLKNLSVPSLIPPKKIKKQKTDYYICTYITANDYESKFIVKAKTKGEAKTKFNSRVKNRKILVDISNLESI